MPTWSALAPFVLLGLLGAAHCAGMCGGFAIAVAAASGGVRRRLLARQLLYVVGKALTYAVLGLTAATAGHLLAHGGADLLGEPARRGEVLEGLRRVMAWVAGATLILFGLGSLGLRPPRRWSGGAGVGVLSRAYRRLYAGAADLPGLAGPLGIGLVTGLLPCGLSWSAFALGAASDVATASVGLALFGLATGPALILVAVGWTWLSQRARGLAARAIGPLLIVFGALTLVRGVPPGGAAEAVLPQCCRSAAHDGGVPGGS